MATPMTADEVLDREFLQIRGKTLELAAAFDRLNRAAGEVETDPRLNQMFDERVEGVMVRVVAGI